MPLRCVRGATTVAENEREAILSAAEEMLAAIFSANGIQTDDIISILFTATKDITKAYPAEAARRLGVVNAGLCCYAEMHVEGSLPLCVRTLVNIETEKKQNEMRHIYLRGASGLRPDLKKNAIAVDGPGGSGKSTAARKVASALGFIYVDTGAMYRAAALYCMENGTDLADERAVCGALEKIHLDIKHVSGVQRIFLNGGDVTDAIRTQAVAEGSSRLAVIGAVREKMVALQRGIAAVNDVVMDGRDIGTHVLPDARLKIYMDASPEIRAKRRVAELEQKGVKADYAPVYGEIIIRDERDINRAHSPLTRAPDAVYMDTGAMGEDEVAEKIAKLYKNGGG